MYKRKTSHGSRISSGETKPPSFPRGVSRLSRLPGVFWQISIPLPGQLPRGARTRDPTRAVETVSIHRVRVRCCCAQCPTLNQDCPLISINCCFGIVVIGSIFTHMFEHPITLLTINGPLSLMTLLVTHSWLVTSVTILDPLWTVRRRCKRLS